MAKLKNILIIGALPYENKDLRETYEGLVNVCKKYSRRVHSPIDTQEFKGSSEKRYQRAFDLVQKADYIIANMCEPSTGQGMEIRESTRYKKPLLGFSKVDSYVSSLVKESPNLINVTTYRDLDDLFSIINTNLEDFTDPNSDFNPLKRKYFRENR